MCGKSTNYSRICIVFHRNFLKGKYIFLNNFEFTYLLHSASMLIRAKELSTRTTLWCKDCPLLLPTTRYYYYHKLKIFICWFYDDWYVSSKHSYFLYNFLSSEKFIVERIKYSKLILVYCFCRICNNIQWKL